jgi:hypothetical protein
LRLHVGYTCLGIARSMRLTMWHDPALLQRSHHINERRGRTLGSRLDRQHRGPCDVATGLAHAVRAY